MIEVQEIIELHNNDESAEENVDIKELEMLEFTTLEELADLKELKATYFDAPPQVVDRHITIGSFTDAQCLELFRFRNHSQLHRLYEGFEIPAKFIANNRSSFTGEEGRSSGRRVV